MLFPHIATENPCIPPCNSNITASCFFHLDVIHSLFYFYFFSRGYWCNCDLPKSRDIFFDPLLSELPPWLHSLTHYNSSHSSDPRGLHSTWDAEAISCPTIHQLWPWWSPKGPALKSTDTPNSWLHSYTAEPSTNCLKYPSPQIQKKQGTICFSRSWVFLLWHSNLGAVRQALRLVWSSLLQALHFTLMLSASKSNTLQAKEFFICFSYMRSSQLSVPDTLIVFCQSSFQLRSAPSFLPNFTSMLHKI